MRTISELLHDAAARLQDHSKSAALDARILMQTLTAYDHPTLITHAHEQLSTELARDYEILLARRIQGEPIAYITGVREFYGLSLGVSPDTLIPRPETELLVDMALAHIPEGADWCIADLGTGSGAIALALAHERPDARFIATDQSAQALEIASANALALGIKNIEFRHGSWYKALDRRCHMILSNPPYVAKDDPHLRQGDVRFEPSSALVSGIEGLDDLEIIIQGACDYLFKEGWLLLEHGHDQAEAVSSLLSLAGFSTIACHKDIAGHARMHLACSTTQR